MRGAAEDSAQRLHVGSRADGQAYAAGAPAARLGQARGARRRHRRPARSRGRRRARRTAPPAAAATYLRAPPGPPTPWRIAAPRREYAPGSRLFSRLHHLGVEVVVEPLDRHHVHRAPALRVIGVERDPVTQIVQCDGQVGDRRALLFVHRSAHRSGLRPPSPRHRAAAAPTGRAAAAGCRGIPPRRAPTRPALDARFDGRVDVDVVALRLAVAAVQAHPKSRQRPPQADGVVDRLGRRRLDLRLDLAHCAPRRAGSSCG